MSLGDGTTIEAMGTKYGVMVASARNRFGPPAVSSPAAPTARRRHPADTAAGAPPQPGRPSPRTDKPYLVQGATGPGRRRDAAAPHQARHRATWRGSAPPATSSQVTFDAVGLFQDQVRTQRDPSMVVDHECGPVTWGWLYFLAG